MMGDKREVALASLLAPPPAEEEQETLEDTEVEVLA
jgi:hypothetical protein